MQISSCNLTVKIGIYAVDHHAENSLCMAFTYYILIPYSYFLQQCPVITKLESYMKDMPFTQKQFKCFMYIIHVLPMNIV